MLAKMDSSSIGNREHVKETLDSFPLPRNWRDGLLPLSLYLSCSDYAAVAAVFYAFVKV